MNENPENRAEIPSQEDQELIDSWLAKYETEEIPPEKRRECGPEVEALEAMFDDFEKAHDLEVLSAINDITTLEEAQAHPIRQPAKLALDQIHNKLRVLKDETNITDERYAELKARWKRFSQALGVLNDGKLDRSPR